MKQLFIVFIISIFFIGCSSKEYFEPNQDTLLFPKDKQLNKTPLEAAIKTFNRKGATLQNQKFILKDGIQDTKLKEGFSLINIINSTIIAADKTGNILVGDKQINFDKVIVAASVANNLLAILFIDNSIGLYDISKDQMVLKEYYQESLVNDIRIANPVILKDIILYPTLDGKIILVSHKEVKVLRTILVDSSAKFNNISFIESINTSLIASTANQIISLKSGKVSSKKFEIRDIIKKDNYLYIATLDGQILKLDSSLNVVGKTKFKYAKIYSLGYKQNKIYAVESQGFIIELDEDLKNQKIYSYKFDNDFKSVLLGDKFYFQKTTLNDKTLKSKTEDFHITLP